MKIIEGHMYRDNHGDVWFNVKPSTRIEGQWMMTTGVVPLTRTMAFDYEGASIMLKGPRMTEDLGPEFDQPTTSATKVDTRVVDEPEPDAFKGEYSGTTTRFPPERLTIVPGERYPHGRYEQLLEETFRRVQELSILKGGEYSGDRDRLANFRRNAADIGVPMEVIWRVYAAKHWDAIGQHIRDLQSGTTRTRLEGLAGRCDDLIVYLVLFKAMLEEKGIE